ncbi:hypothetical protein [Flammeovirga agarivorans]|uniref:Lipoprotein n=1 Tax=Flammeovirga agarivorans TaxID=2726742 RepID=A0A7X8SRQ3_9BACT|nr:hypothetical protein [Flammeovirga agarivorans]NLR95048.1 hypothetical protein [Flammeovirga agarivorans]
MKSKLIILFSFILSSCYNNEELRQNNEIRDLITNSVSTVEETFTITKNDEIDIETKDGVKINFKWTDLDFTNIPQPSSIKVFVKNYQSNIDMFFNNLETISNDTLLISGGSIQITIKSNSKNVRLKNGSFASIYYPRDLNLGPMSLFYLDSGNWVKAPVNVDTTSITKIDTVFYRTKDNPLYYTRIPIGPNEPRSTLRTAFEEDIFSYYYAKLPKLDYINFDYLPKSVLTNIQVNVLSDNITQVDAHLIFKDINSYKKSIIRKEDSFYNIPVGSTFTLLAFSIVGEKIYFLEKEIRNVREGMSLNLKLKESSKDIIKKRLKKLKKTLPNNS